MLPKHAANVSPTGGRTDSLQVSSHGSRTALLSLPLSGSRVFSCVKPSGTNVSGPRRRRPSDHLQCVGLRGGNLRSELRQLDTRAGATPLHTPSSLNTTLHTSANPTACTKHSTPHTVQTGLSHERVGSTCHLRICSRA